MDKLLKETKTEQKKTKFNIAMIQSLGGEITKIY